MNVRGLQPKRFEMSNLLKNKDVHLAVISETHAKNDDDISVNGYAFIGSEAKTGASGGVGVLIQNKLLRQIRVKPIKNDLIETGRLIKAE